MGQVLAVPGARPPPALTDHLVEEILVRVATPRDLIRASAACASFRRLVPTPLPLPPIPERLVASQLLGPALDVHFDCFDAFFVPSGDYEEAHFRVIGWTHCEAMAAVIIYSSLSGAWTAGTSTTWNALGLVVEAIPENSWWPSYVYGCFYWHVQCSNMLLKLDINRMEFSAVGLPPVRENQRLAAAAEAGEGRIGILTHIAGQGIPESLCYSVRQNEGENAIGHPVETAIQLPGDYDKYRVVAAAQGYIFLLGSRFVYQQGTHKLIGGSSAFFSLEIKTLKIQRVCSTRGALCDHVLPYFGFPPFMSPARI